MTQSSGSRLTIIFDLGGVLIDWNPRYLYRKLFIDDPDAMEWFLSNVCTQDWNVRQDAGRSFTEAVAELVAHYPAYEDLIKAYHRRWEEMIAGPIEPTVDILSELKEAGYPLCALSNWSAETFSLVRPRFQFLDWFDLILVSGEVGLIKPDPRLFALLLHKIDRTPEDCLFIDDHPANVEAARALGMKAIQFETPAQLRAELDQKGILS
jgi:2-haloacid dehalogenase